jgi:hypothetical protein
MILTYQIIGSSRVYTDLLIKVKWAEFLPEAL